MKILNNYFKKHNELKSIKPRNEIRSGWNKSNEMKRGRDGKVFIKPPSAFDGLYMRDSFSLGHKFF
jgi:hypothetical protein